MESAVFQRGLKEWRGPREVLERSQRGPGEVLERSQKGPGEVLGERAERFWGELREGSDEWNSCHGVYKSQHLLKDWRCLA